MKNSFLYTVVFTFVLSFVFVLILSYTNELTKDKIAGNAKFAKERAILQTFGVDTDDPDEVDNEFSDIQIIEKNGKTYYVREDEDDDDATIYSTSYEGPGLWGVIKGFISVDKNLTKVVGFSITDQNETPGLGARIAEKWFLDQLKGESIVDDVIEVGGGSTGDDDKGNGSIDGITGATRTSDGIQRILTRAIKRFKKDL